MIPDPVCCQWPGCPEISPLVMWGEIEEWCCLEHCTDEFLPQWSIGTISICVHCGKATPCMIHYDDEMLWVHPKCLRQWTRLQNASPEELPEKITLGAYGRRSSRN